jgi:hypothetical protein
MFMTTNELITKMEEVFNTLKTEQAKVTKKAKNNARKSSTELRKLLVEFKKASLVESKQ